ncbi:hypothetical protein ACFYNO_06955 [Kitasatospora sp. NPDC006697]|uniref:hypothetical protein n=1 Tax=Kitasatospora sp. NPDC006697 TaxID=3364020 RepID=UPI0036ADB88C
MSVFVLVVGPFNGTGVWQEVAGRLEQVVRSGPSQLRAPAYPRGGFFELATGHWPMVSDPRSLALLFRRAAADEGLRLTVPDAQLSAFSVPAPPCPRERHGRVGLHLPAVVGPAPAVPFVHGGRVALWGFSGRPKRYSERVGCRSC